MSEPLNLGQIVDALRMMPPDAWVKTPLGAPTHAVSYRGFYDQLALVIEADSVKAGDLLAELEASLAGETRDGWKGGTYHYNRDAQVWCVLGSGYTSDCGIIAIARSDSDESGYRECEISLGWQRW